MAIALIDYHKGNLLSVQRGLEAVGAQVVVTDSPTDIAEADGIVLPGVGAFEDAMDFMNGSGQADAVRASLGRGVPFLGICLGLQLLFERGDERTSGQGAATDRWVPGLGVLEGSVTRLVSDRLKVPHVGWDQVHVTQAGRACPLLRDFADGTNMYFTHSYAVDADCDPDVVVARTHYVRSFPSVVWRGNVFGCQFHPEKSSGAGAAILAGFARVVAQA
ncbi:MAG: imidazole glycerol phosphate synthase subunit HisH [Atopobiaceae bacterium]|jgi:glutamine amidotransferase|nr:imidazole glycerol phosphate synthase subunit HisH [Atopobiaceae bacterium]MCH4180785.1 imidazole glycerol phosphate synthase subunit HisH [Atopobiaceae bacterium]MCH4214450.1 imidazole glycerol phosphate synthase subunit HisH [Atopobiaceae bacterium]MCH4229380.1 imidazole glycerol phosphate synthase subunit HisH [Atopobiaceae bacterium]MCH4276662.1 imidazole glycerol phosphate synthase subunit HisH [Atopobiaceae bacterium]